MRCGPMLEIVPYEDDEEPETDDTENDDRMAARGRCASRDRCMMYGWIVPGPGPAR